MQVRKYPKSLKTLRAGALVMAAAGAGLILDGQTAAGLLGMAFFGFVAWVIHRRLQVPPAVLLTVDESGVDYRPLGLGPIPWQDIRQVRESRAEPIRFLSLILEDPAPYQARLDEDGQAVLAESAAFELPPFSFCFSEMEPDLDAVLAEIRRLAPGKLATPGPAGSLPGGPHHA